MGSSEAPEDPVVVVVDLQRDFIDPEVQSDACSLEKAFCIPGVRRLLTHARTMGWPVVHVGTGHADRETLPAHQRRSGREAYCVTGSRGHEFVVEPEGLDIGIYKRWYSAFDSDLESLLAGRKTVVWAGIATDCCIQQSVFEADRLDIRSIVPIECVSASSRDSFAWSLASMSKSAGEVVNLDRLLEKADDYAALPDGEVKDAAEMWFKQQETKMNGKQGLTLEDLLHRLEQ